MSSPSRSPLLVLHRWSWRLLQFVRDGLQGLWAGLWLGLLKRRHLHAVDEESHSSSKSYTGVEHNRAGLFEWETEAIERFFSGCRRLLLLGAGGGRELLPLLDRGFEVVAFECHPGLREAGNRLLERPGAIRAMERDLCPELRENFEGIIIGWGMLTLIPGRASRVRLLCDLRAAVSLGTPMLLSFFLIPGSPRPYRIAYRLGHFLRRLLRREGLDFGDYLKPGYTHFFSRESLEVELAEAGWQIEFFDRRLYPHAVARASDTTPLSCPVRTPD